MKKTIYVIVQKHRGKNLLEGHIDTSKRGATERCAALDKMFEVKEAFSYRKTTVEL